MAKKKQSLLHKKLHLSHKKHTGKMLAVEHTSRGVLVVIMFVTGVIVAIATHQLKANAYIQTGQGSVQLGGLVKQIPPSQPAVILKPYFGQVFTTSPIVVSGTCQLNKFVQIYRNHKAVDAVACIRGEFAATVDLVPGKNNFVIRTLDNLFQFGPNSEAVNAFYNPPSSAGPRRGGDGLEVTISSDMAGFATNQRFDLTATIEGGIAPYALNINWGDGGQDYVPVASAGSVSFTHKYNHSDIFQIKVNVKDAKGNTAGAETAVLIGGSTITGTSTGRFLSPPKSLVDLIWPIYAVSITAVTLFWLGERFEFVLLKRAGLLKRKV